jgi:hypothetical protein
MVKLKNIINESAPGYENRKFGDPLPTLADVAKKYNENKKTISEKKELGSAYIESIRMLNVRDSGTRARAELARQIGDKRVIKAYEGLMYVEVLLKQANETIKARTKLDKILFAKSKKVFSNHDIIMSVF